MSFSLQDKGLILNCYYDERRRLSGWDRDGGEDGMGMFNGVNRKRGVLFFSRAAPSRAQAPLGWL
jgi:hypothetical protein